MFRDRVVSMEQTLEGGEKNLELLKKLINRQGKIISRRKSGCTAVSQRAATDAIKRARYMALLPYVGE